MFSLYFVWPSCCVVGCFSVAFLLIISSINIASKTELCNNCDVSAVNDYHRLSYGSQIKNWHCSIQKRCVTFSVLYTNIAQLQIFLLIFLRVNGNIGLVYCPPRSLDFAVFFFVVMVKNMVYKISVNKVEDLRVRVLNAFAFILLRDVKRAIHRNIRRRLRSCIQENGNLFEHLT